MFRIYPIRVSFVNTPLGWLDAEYVIALQRLGAMDVAKFRLRMAYKDVNEFVAAGAAIRIRWGSEANHDEFIGYVHSFRPGTEGYVRYTEFVAISAAYPMINESGRTFYDVGIHNIAQEIGDDYRFQVETDPHPFVNSQVLQQGDSDWGLLLRLGQQWGYILRAEGVTLIFRPLGEVLEENYRLAIPAKTYADYSTPGAQIMSFEQSYSSTETVPKTNVVFKGVDPLTIQPILQREVHEAAIFDEVDTSKAVTSDIEGELKATAVSAAKRFPFHAKATMFAPFHRRPLDVYRIENDGQIKTWVIESIKHVVSGDSYTAEVELGTDGEDRSVLSGRDRMDVSVLLKRNQRARRPVPVIVDSRPFYLGTGANAVVGDQRWKAQVMTVPVDREAS